MEELAVRNMLFKVSQAARKHTKAVVENESPCGNGYIVELKKDFVVF